MQAPDVPIIILTLLREGDFTGVNTHVNTLRRFLETRGFSVIVLTPFHAPAWVTYPLVGLRRLIEPLNRDIAVRWYRHWHAFLLGIVYRRALRFERAIVYAQCPVSAHVALSYRASSNHVVVMATHFNVSQADEWAGKGFIRRDSDTFKTIVAFEDQVMVRLDGIIFVSKYMSNIIHGRLPQLRDIASAIVPNFCDSGVELVPEADRKQDLISVGTLEARKNQQYLLRVVAEAMHRGKSYSLTLVGHGPDRAPLESLTRELGISRLVEFRGSLPNAARLIGAHKIFVHAALVENMPITFLEALANGVPILAPEVGGVPEIFRNGTEGFFWPLDDTSRAADILIELMENKILRRKLATAARARFAAAFNADVVAERLTNSLFDFARPAATGRS
jgi:glycosyltransferase involved in cell wall biosynthesis